jgi:hypothetical protein
MKGMRATGRLIGAGFMLATTMAAFAVFAQEAVDELEPAVDTSTMLDEVLAPLDREEFIRQVDYYGDLYGE